MASVVYNRGKRRLLAGLVDLNNIRIMVLTGTTTIPDDPDHKFVSDISADEAAGSGYTRTQALTNVEVVEDDANDEAILRHDDAIIPAYGPDSPAQALVYFEEAASDSARSLLWINDLSTLDENLRTPDGSDLIIRSPIGGVMKATNGS